MRRFRNVTKCISCMAVALMLCVMSGWFTQEVFAEWGDGEQDGIIYGYDTDSKEAYVYDYEGDATGKGDFVYNANSSDELYFYNDDGSTSDNVTLTKNGQNLIVNYGGADTTAVDKVNFVNYFKTNTDLFDINESDMANAEIIQTGKENKANKLTDTKYNDLITGGNKNDTYNFKNGGKDAVTDEKGNDTYKVKTLANALTITDKAGTKDKLIVSDKNGYNLYFEVTRNGQSVSGVGNDLQIFDKTKMDDKKIAGGVTIKDYIAGYNSESGVTKGDGCIETIKIGGTSVNIDVNSIANNVAGWLSTNNFDSTTAVFTSGSADNVAAMLNVYMGQA